MKLRGGQDFFRPVDEEDIVAFSGQSVLLQPVGFSDPAFEEIALDRSFEEFLGYGNHDPAVAGCIGTETVRQGVRFRELPLGKKHGDVVLAAQSFSFRKGVAGRFEGHIIGVLPDKFPRLSRQKALSG